MSSHVPALFQQTAAKFTEDSTFVLRTWERISKRHQGKSRHYHTLRHLNAIAENLEEIKHYIEDWESIVFAIFFHDFVYNVLRKDNEIKSASEARSFLTHIGFPEERMNRVVRHIEATATHVISADGDTNLFTDADLAVLGGDPNEYDIYRKGIRKEYSWYPDVVYNPGRKKVLEHFLSMENIYKTQHFRRLERQARINLKQELLALSR